MTGFQNWVKMTVLDLQEKLIIMLKIGEMVCMRTQNQHYLAFLNICSLNFSKIVGDGNY